MKLSHHLSDNDRIQELSRRFRVGIFGETRPFEFVETGGLVFLPGFAKHSRTLAPTWIARLDPGAIERNGHGFRHISDWLDAPMMHVILNLSVAIGRQFLADLARQATHVLVADFDFRQTLQHPLRHRVRLELAARFHNLAQDRLAIGVTV